MVKDIKIPDINLDQMQSVGLHLGHRVSRLHPKMRPFVTGIKNNIHIIDLEKSSKELNKALRFIVSFIQEGKTILFVGTKPQIREIVKKAAQTVNMPYVTERWLGGTFTNFETILKRIQYFNDLERKKESGELQKYTKKEQMIFNKELEILSKKFSGIRNISKLPEAVLIFDLRKEMTCVREARRKKIKIIGIVDTNVDPNLADYPIPGNDNSISSINYILEKITETIKENS